eukprot:Amastigsp_a848292_22.p3 type:complete len:160 gc:universal Amastigsp_a848292_22:589-110(-)
MAHDRRRVACGLACSPHGDAVQQEDLHTQFRALHRGLRRASSCGAVRCVRCRQRAGRVARRARGGAAAALDRLEPSRHLPGHARARGPADGQHHGRVRGCTMHRQDLAVELGLLGRVPELDWRLVLCVVCDELCGAAALCPRRLCHAPQQLVPQALERL